MGGGEAGGGGCGVGGGGGGEWVLEGEGGGRAGGGVTAGLVRMNSASQLAKPRHRKPT